MTAPSYPIELVAPDGSRETRTLTEAVSVGRDTTWSLLDAEVSRRHLELEPISAGVIVRDLGSSNGTRVNGHLLTGPVTISAGDVVEIGSCRLGIAPLPEPPGAPSPATPAQQPAPQPPAPQQPPGQPAQPPPQPPPATPPPQQPPTQPAQPPPQQPPATPPPQQPPAQPAQPPPQQPPATPPPQQPPAQPAQPPPQPGGGPPQPGPPAAPPPPPQADQPSHRPDLDELTELRTDAAVIRFRPGSVGESRSKAVAKEVGRARRRLAGLGSEPWGVLPQICLVDPFPDPDRPGEIITSGAIVDASRNEIWVAVTSDRPTDPPERYLSRFFGASLPAGDELGLLLDGYGLHLARDDIDDELRDRELPPLGAADEELAPLMAASFVGFLIEREGDEAFVRFLAAARPGALEAAAREVYGDGLARLQQTWHTQLGRGDVKAQPRAFLKLAFREMRPHAFKQGEIAVYMLMGLGFTTVFPFVFRELVDTAIPSGEWSEVVRLLGFLAGVLAISQLATLRRAYLSAYVSASVVHSIRTRMFERLQRLSPGWFHKREQGDVLSRFFSDVNTLEAGFSATLRDGAFQFLTLVVSAVVLLILHPLLAAIVLAGVPAMVLVYRWMATGALKRSMAVQERNGALLNVSGENYSAQPVVKAFGLEPREMNRFGAAAERLFSSTVRLSLFGGVYSLAVNSVVAALRLVVLAVGTWLILEGRFTIGGLVAFMGVMGEVLGPIGQLTNIGQQLQRSTGALARINEVLEADLDVADAEGAVDLPPLQHEIRFENASFSYVPGGELTLEGVDCTIPAGSKVAFVGPSGAGKSSVLNLLLRFYDVHEGAVRIDGVDIRHATLASLRRQMGVVFQDSFLFDTTVRENIRLGRTNATDEEIEEAARAAQIHDTVLELPNGYDTLVGERGGRLSGGQRQRIAIARAILRNPTILVLDEATSALDPRTERQIASTLDELGEGRTTISVTHRLASAVGYDRIFVLVDGRLVEQGTHDELVAQGGTYSQLWAEQTGAPVPVAEAPFDPVEALGQVSLFASLDRVALEEVAQQLRPVELAPGERIPEGGGRLWIVRGGRGRVLVPGSDGQLRPVSELTEGQAFGVTALLGQEAGVELEAAEPLRLLVLDDERLIGIAARHPSVGHMLAGDRAAGPAPVGGTRLTATLGPGVMTTIGPESRMTVGANAGVPDAEEIRRTLGPSPQSN